MRKKDEHKPPFKIEKGAADPPNPFAGIPDSALKAELQTRQDARDREALAQRDDHNRLVVENIDLLLALRPNHSYAACSDERPRDDRCCGRCVLLEIKRIQWMDRELRVDVEIANDSLRDPDNPSRR